jgi:hypothetical protein
VMKDLKLTDEQVARAVEAYYKAGPTPTAWETVPSATKYRIGEQLRAAAPFLQAPWEMPTDCEIEQFEAVPQYSVRSRLCQFVQVRNAGLLPNPVDPRREAVIAEILDGTAKGSIRAEILADRILAALDGNTQEATRG